MLVTARLLARAVLDRTPFPRAVDRTEAWIVFSLMMILFAVAVPVTVRVAQSVTRDGVHQERLTSDSHLVQAKVLHDVPDLNPNSYGPPPAVSTTVQWKAPDGTTRSGLTRVAPGTVAGTTEAVWTDAHGNLADAPQRREDTILSVCAALFLLGFLIMTAAAAVAMPIHHRFERRRMQQWEREWRRVGPAWSRMR